jgi:hypothetical protein
MITTFTFLLVFTAQWVAFAIVALFTLAVAVDLHSVLKDKDVDMDADVTRKNILTLLASMFVWSFLLMVGHSI